jgi:hypothetical protein
MGLVDPHLDVTILALEEPDSWGGQAAAGFWWLVTLELRSTAVEMLIEGDHLNIAVFDSAGGRHAPQHPETGDPGVWRFPFRPATVGGGRAALDHADHPVPGVNSLPRPTLRVCTLR